MARIPEHIVENVRQVADIHDVISEYVNLKKRGRNFFGLCPFHNEKTPSFSVNQDKQIYKCFGCGAGGGVINFVMDVDNIDFITATRKLASMYNIEIADNEKDKYTKDLKSQLLKINSLALNFFQQNLNSSNGEKIKQYLIDRNFNQSTIDTFNLGYSGTSPKALLETLQKNNLNANALKQSGLFYESDKGYFDRFRSRLIFPINDKSGNIIAFAGRIVDNNQNIAKYINSPETPIYNKSKTFYGLDKASDSIRKNKFVVIVEGYFDLMRLYQNGLSNVVAISGTSFTDQHASIIKQYTENIFIAFDGDIPGIKSAIKTGYILIKNSISPKIILIPKNQDPDDYVQENGLDAFIQIKDNSLSVLNTHFIFFKAENENFNVNTFINEAVENISTIIEPIFREIIAKELSELVNISEESILFSINKIIDKKNNFKKIREQVNPNTKSDTKNPSSNILLEDDLIRLCFNKDISIRKIIYKYIEEQWIQSPIHLQIFKSVFIHLKSEDEVPLNIIINETVDSEIRKKIVSLTFDIHKFQPTLNMAIDCLIRLEKQALKLSLINLRDKLKTSQDATAIINEISIVETNIKELELKYNE